MSDQTVLSEADKKRILDWLNKHWRGPRSCNICGHNNWNVAEHIVAPSVSYGGSVMVGGPTYPHVLVICTTCANTHFFNWAMIDRAMPIGAKPTGERNG